MAFYGKEITVKLAGDTPESIKADYQTARALWLLYKQEQAHCRKRLEFLAYAVPEQERYMDILSQVETDLEAEPVVAP